MGRCVALHGLDRREDIGDKLLQSSSSNIYWHRRDDPSNGLVDRKLVLLHQLETNRGQELVELFKIWDKLLQKTSDRIYGRGYRWTTHLFAVLTQIFQSVTRSADDFQVLILKADSNVFQL